MESTDSDPRYNERVARQAEITIDGPLYTVKNLRAMRFPGPETRIVEWRTETFDIRELTNVYFVVSWWTARTFLAHTMVSFEFSDGRVITPSVEIRPRVGQKFSAIAGLRKTFGITYVWSTEADALLSRIYSKDDENVRINLLEAVLSQQAAARLFHTCAERAQEMHANHEYYHTVTNSCTSNIFAIAAAALPGDFKRPAKSLMPGYTPRYLARNGALKMQGDFNETIAATAVSDLIIEIGDAPDFSSQLRDRMRSR